MRLRQCPGCRKNIFVTDKHCGFCRHPMELDDTTEYAFDRFKGAPSCKEFDLFFNINQFSIVGSTFIISFLIQFLEDQMWDFFFDLNVPDNERLTEKKSWKSKAGKRTSLNLNLKARTAGSPMCSFHIGFRHDKLGDIVYRGEIQHKILPEIKESGKLIDSLIFNFKDEIRMGYAENINISHGAGGLESVLKNLKPDMELKEIIQKVIDSEREWCRLSLEPSDYRPDVTIWKPRKKPVRTPIVSVVSDHSVEQALTLKTPKFRIHLTTETLIPFGRARPNNRIVTRIFDDRFQLLTRGNTSISRWHGRFRVISERVELLDGGIYTNGQEKQSKEGILLNSFPVSFGMPAVIESRKPSELVFPKPSSERIEVFRLEISPWTCPEIMCEACNMPCKHKRPASIIIKRIDALPEVYIIIRHCLEMGFVHDSLRGLIVWSDNGRLCYSTKEQSGRLLDTNLVVSGLPIETITWRQYCLSGDQEDIPTVGQAIRWANPDEWMKWLKKEYV